MGLITVIIPVYNVKKYLEKCLSSVIDQTYRELEILLVEDGSTDGSSMICDQFAARDTRIRVIHQVNHGVSYSRNVGLDQAAGEYIFFVDSDDYLEKTALEQLYAIAVQYGCDVVQAVNDKDGLQERVNRITVFGKHELVESRLIPCFVCNKLYRSTLLEKMRFVEGRISEDFEWLYRVVYAADSIVLLQEILYHVVESPGSLSRGIFSERKLDAIGFCEEKMDFYQQKKETAAYWKAQKQYISILIDSYQNAAEAGAVQYLDGIVWKIWLQRKLIWKNSQASLKWKVFVLFFLLKQGRHKITGFLYSFVRNHKAWREREQVIHPGKKNPDKIFYCIRFDNESFGLLTVWKFVIGHLAYASANGYIPIIDLKNYYSFMLQDENKKYHENAWDYYFQQPQKKYSLEEVMQSRNVILGYKNMQTKMPLPLIDLPMDQSILSEWYALSKQLPIQEAVAARVAEEREKLFPSGARILGASVRMEYNYLQEIGNKIVEGHPAQPTVEELLEEIDQCMQEWSCDYCFVTVDDQICFERIKDHLGEKCLCLDRHRYHFYQKADLQQPSGGNFSLHKSHSSRHEVKKIRLETMEQTGTRTTVTEYLAELQLLAACTCLLAGKSSGNAYAYLLNNCGYEKVKIYEKGIISIK